MLMVWLCAAALAGAPEIDVQVTKASEYLGKPVQLSRLETVITRLIE